MFRSSEQSDFSKIVAAHVSNPMAPLLLEGATGLGKTTAFLAALIDTKKSVGICLATNALVEQMVNSTDLERVQAKFPDRPVAVFRSRKHFIDEDGTFDSDAFGVQKAAALGADVLICTASSVLYDQRLNGAYNGVTQRDVILFDEADQIPGLAALASNVRISGSTLKDLKCTGSTPAQVIEKLLGSRLPDLELKAKARILAEAHGEPETWYRKVGMTDDGGIALVHRLPGRLLKKISNRASTIFISATLSVSGNFNDFMRSMGIETQSKLSDIIEPQHHGHLTFDFIEDHDVGTSEWMDAVVEQIEFAEEPVLVATSSHSLAQELGERVSGATVRRTDGETMTDAIMRMGDRQVVIGAGAWAGMDTPVQWKTVIAPNVPFEAPDVLFDEMGPGGVHRQTTSMNSYLNSRNSAIRRMRQLFGRGIRHPDAECHVVICDPRVSQLGDIYPKRFEKVWMEGGRSQYTLSKIERNPKLRKDALEHYGMRCQACDHVPMYPRELEVHHRFPLAAEEGQASTKIEDVSVLCRTCHGRAHGPKGRLHTLEELKEFARKGAKKNLLMTF